MTESALNPALSIYLKKTLKECEYRTSVSYYSQSNLRVQLQTSPPAPLMSSDLTVFPTHPFKPGQSSLKQRGAAQNLA